MSAIKQFVKPLVPATERGTGATQNLIQSIRSSDKPSSADIALALASIQSQLDTFGKQVRRVPDLADIIEIDDPLTGRKVAWIGAKAQFAGGWFGQLRIGGLDELDAVITVDLSGNVVIDNTVVGSDITIKIGSATGYVLINSTGIITAIRQDSAAAFIGEAYGSAAIPGFVLRKADGTIAAPTDTADGEMVGLVLFSPRVGGAWDITGSLQAFYSTSHGTKLFLQSAGMGMEVRADGIEIGGAGDIIPAGYALLMNSATWFAAALGIDGLTASRPVKSDANKNLISGQINLSTTNEVTGTLPITQGGTGQTSAANARTALGAATATAYGGGTIPLAKLTSGGTDGSLSFNADGVLISAVNPT